jgi:hypothetical protein
VFAFEYLIITRAGKVVRVMSEIEEGDAFMLKVLVAKDSRSKAVFAHAVRAKGTRNDHYGAAALVEDLKWLGDSHVCLRSDNENPILKLLKEALIDLRIKVVDTENVEQIVQEEHPTKYVKQANGLAEGAVKTVTGMIRVIKFDLEDSIQKLIPGEHPILHWLVEWAAWQWTTRYIGSDGQTAYQRASGKS